MDPLNIRLRELILDPINPMDVPGGRIDDIKWLGRNLSIQNSKNPNFREAISLVKQIQQRYYNRSFVLE